VYVLATKILRDVVKEIGGSDPIKKTLAKGL
jgi:hypothetical protein